MNFYSSSIVYTYFTAPNKQRSLRVKVLERKLHCPLPDCGSSDAYEITERDDGTVFGYCHSCSGYVHKPFEGDLALDILSPKGAFPKQRGNQYNIKVDHYVSDIDEALLHPVREISDRCISHAACERYGVRVGVDTRDGVTPVYHLYPAYRKGKLTGFKQRIISTKQFKVIGDCKNLDLFGANTIPPTGKKLFITEGELDCLALYTTLKKHSTLPGWEPPVVSLPSGASGAAKSISQNLELIDGYEEIILCFDSDEPGEKAATEVCKILAGKVYVVSLPEKDPCDMVIKGKSLDLKWAVLTHARKYRPDGVVNGEDAWDRYKHTKNEVHYPYPSTMPGLNEKVFGVVPGTIITITAGTGTGKTQFCRELKYHFLKTTDYKIADVELEADVGETVEGMLSIHLNKRLSLPTVNIPEETERRAFEEIYGTGRITYYDYFGGMDDESLFSKLRYFAATGHKLIFFDHISFLVSEHAASGGERERLDTTMTKLAKFVKETGTILFLVVHLSKSAHRPFEEGIVPTLDDLRGSSTLKQLSWYVIALSRNQQHPDPLCKNIMKLTVLKGGRKGGKTGDAGALMFDDSSGRYFQAELPPNYYVKRNNQ